MIFFGNFIFAFVARMFSGNRLKVILVFLAVCRTHVIHEPSIWPVHHKSLVAQWFEHPTGVRKVIGSISVGDSDFFFVPRS